MNYYNYFTEIEDHFVRRRGKHMLVSPMDWSLIATWRDAGVPLHVALRGIDIAMDTWHSRPRRRSDKLSSLFYCHDSVMEEYERHLESHLGEDKPASETASSLTKSSKGSSEGPDKAQVAGFLDSRILEIKSLRAKHSQWDELDRIVSRLEEIARFVQSEEHVESETLERDLGILNELLLTCLKSRVLEEQTALWEADAKNDLKVYRKRLPKETYNKILGNYLRAKIYRMFNIGELSLFQL